MAQPAADRAADAVIAGSVRQVARRGTWEWNVVLPVPDVDGTVAGGATKAESPVFEHAGFRFRLCSWARGTHVDEDDFVSGYLLALPPGEGGAWPECSWSLQVARESTGRRSKPKVTRHQFGIDGEDDWGFSRLLALGATPLAAGGEVFRFTLRFLSVQLGPGDALYLPAQPGNLAGMQRFYHTSELSDCSIASEGGRVFAAHRVVLSAASPALAAMFTTSSGLAEGASAAVVLRGAETEVVEALLRSMYGIAIERLPVPHALPLLQLADQWQVVGVKQLVQAELLKPCNEFTPAALAGLLQQAVGLGDAGGAVSARLVAEARACLPAMSRTPQLLAWPAQVLEQLLPVLSAQVDAASPDVLQLAAAWATAPAAALLSGEAEPRREVWPRLMPLIPLPPAPITWLKRLRQEVPGLLELPGLAAQLLERVLDDA